MSQPIDVGSVLSGRYQVTENVLTSAEGDLVLSGIDQVLNRTVSILVASQGTSEQLATSAREIAMDQRASNVQVLDLGVTETNQTYLVTNPARATDLLDLVLSTEAAPYVEPFFTDTLGTEIFGESRQAVPETYEDQDGYYEEIQYDDPQEEPEHKRRGAALGAGFAGLKNRFGKKHSEHENEQSEQDVEVTSEEATSTATAPVAAVNNPDTQAEPEQKPKVTKLDKDAEPSVTATAALAAAAQSKGTESASQQESVEEDETDSKKKAAVAGAAGAGAAASLAAAPKASTFPAGAKNVPAQDEPLVEDEPEEEGNNKGVRLMVGAVLIAVLVIAVVFAFNFLGNGSDRDPQAGTPTQQSTEQPTSQEPSGETEPSETGLPDPEVAGVSRLVPGNQELNAETDNTLSKMTDGNPSSTYKTYSYTTGNFGGFASNMVLILDLEQKSGVHEINLEGLNATGGNYEVLVGTSDDLGKAKSVANGSFSGPSISIPVNGDGQDFMEGTHVFLNITDLPRVASGANSSRPYGLQIGEFSVK
ncbi:hypothetical protein GCM10027417_25330 [Glutamicibacter endophyticus]